MRRVLQNKPGMLLLSHNISSSSSSCKRCKPFPPNEGCAWAHSHSQAWALISCTCHTGVQSVDIDLAQQKVVVKGDVSQEDILQTVSKTGKKTELWQ